MELVDQKIKKQYKNAAYVRYNKVMKSLLGTGAYTSAKETLSTYLALNLATQLSERTLIELGVDEKHLRMAAMGMRSEMVLLHHLHKTGKAKELLESYAKEQQKEQQKKKKKKAKKRKKK